MGKTRWQKLNAYVDGELTARDAADVANAAAGDGALTEQILLLHDVKGAIQEAFPPAPADLASVVPPRPLGRLPAVATILAAVAIAAFVLLFVSAVGKPPVDGAATLVASARTMHDNWLARETADTVDTPPVVLAALARFGRLPLVPDLAATGLSVALVSVSDIDGEKVLQIGYRGIHGCHLSLFVFARNSLATQVDDLGRLERAHVWQAADLAYLLFSRGMDESRFSLIAEKVEHATRMNAPFDERARMQLALNKRNAASCES